MTNQYKQHDRLMAQLAADQPVDLSLGEHVLAAYAEFQNADREVWMTGVFHFVRGLKSHPSLEKLTAKAALAEVEKVFAGWMSKRGSSGNIKARATEAWESYFDIDRDTARAEFLTSWDKVRCVAGRGPWQEAWHLAQTRPVKWGDDHVSMDSPVYHRFLSFSGWLQVSIGAAPFWLPVRDVGKLLGVTPMMVSKYRQIAVLDRWLREVEKPVYPSKKATRFVFDVSRVPMMRGAAHADVLAWCEEKFR
jgi:hypothetical protein